MCFVDGENLTARGQHFASEHGLTLLGGRYWKKDRFLWLPTFTPQSMMLHEASFPLAEPVRSYYYTALNGDDDAVAAVRESLWALGFEPAVFKKRGERSKGVDLTLARDLLSHAFQGHFDVACILAGDADYVPLVEEVKRPGKTVCVCFFETDGLANDLRLAADAFYPLDAAFEKAWQSGFAT